MFNQISNHLSVLSAGGAAVSVTSNELSAAVKVSAKSAATSVQGLQSVINQVSNRISAIVAGAQSVTSQELSVAAAGLSTRIDTASAANVTETNNRISADNVLSFRISVVSNNLSIETADRLSQINAMSNLLSAAAVNTASVLSTLSNNISINGAAISNLTSAHNALSNRVSANSAVGGGASVTSAELSALLSIFTSALTKASAKTTAGTSVQGLQSAINALSSKAGGGGGGSVTSTKVSLVGQSVLNVASANLAALSVIVKNLSDTVSNRTLSLAALSLAVSAAETHASTASAAATSADGHANTASLAATSVDQRATSLEARLSTLSTQHNTLCNLVSNALSAGDVTSANIAGISTRLQALSAGIGSIQLNRLQTTATVSAAALTKLSGLSVQLVSGGAYKIKGILMHSHSTQTTNGFGFGVSATAPTIATGIWRGATSIANGAISIIHSYFNQAGLGSITYSATPSASGVVYRTELDMDIVGAVSTKLQLKARSSATGVGAIDVRAGSYIQAFRLA